MTASHVVALLMCLLAAAGHAIATTVFMEDAVCAVQVAMMGEDHSMVDHANAPGLLPTTAVLHKSPAEVASEKGGPEGGDKRQGKNGEISVPTKLLMAVPTASGPPDYCEGQVQMGSARTVVTNNLGGLGPTAGDPVIHIESFIDLMNGRTVDLFVSNLTTYVPNNVDQNGLKGDFNNVNIKAGFVDLLFTFKDTVTKLPEAMPAFNMTIYDLDGPKNDVYTESVAIDTADFTSYKVTDSTDVTIAQEAGRTVFGSSAYGEGCDNPTSIETLGVVVCKKSGTVDQKDRSVAVEMKGGRSSYHISIKAGKKANGGRNFLFGTPAYFDKVCRSPTQSPTLAPTAAPTGPPSDSPTSSPTGSPTSSPSSSPTSSPTGSPTNSPSSSPTSSPTGSPTGSPSSSPTTSPTGSPTSSPSSSPTSSPTGSPTSSPSSSPTTSPTGSPTSSPSSSPTTSPTGSPTSSPSSSPTTSPTGFPTGSPSSSPTSSPTGSPTGSPSSSPTTSPTSSPSSSPTSSPTGSPTGSPSSSPTSSPTGSPTSSPSSSPTSSPTGSPTSSPSSSPTTSPTGSPTSSPSSSPTSSPTGSPTSSPSSSPTSSPTSSPSSSPTTSPTGSPTSSPSSSPTSSPTWHNVATSFGDPHVTNLKGDRFDILQTDYHNFLVIPRGADAQHALLHVVAKVDPLGQLCSGLLYVTSLRFTGRWVGDIGSLEFTTSVRAPMKAEAMQIRAGASSYLNASQFRAAVPQRLAEVTEFQPQQPRSVNQHVDLLLVKLKLGPSIAKVRMVYQKEKFGFSNSLWLTTTGLGQVQHEIGGILGVDDHTFAASRPKKCVEQDQDAASALLGLPTPHGSVYASASLEDED